MGRLAFGPVFVAAAVSIAFYVGLYFALRPHTPSKASLVGDIDIEAGQYFAPTSVCFHITQYFIYTFAVHQNFQSG